MSKRTHDDISNKESREERWKRKIEMYEQKILAKRQRNGESRDALAPPSNENDVQNEGT
jgi:hypothetical protein